MGISGRHMRRLLKRPEMQRVFREVQVAMFEDLDKIITDEKLAPLVRAQAQSIRAQTAIHEVIEEVRGRVKGGYAKATEMKVLVDAGFGMIDRAKGELAEHSPGQSGGAVNVQINLTSEKTNLLRDVISESGVDLTDIIDVTPVESEDAKEV